MPYMKILIPFDGSPDAVFACETAMNIVCENPAGRTFTLVYCFEHIADLVGGKQREEVRQHHQQKARKILEQGRQLFENRGFSCTVLQREGAVADEIASTVEETGSEAIIMGAKGEGSLKSMILGSVSQGVLHRVNIPVLLACSPVS